MLIIGSHVNFKGDQLLGATKQALEYGANTFMFYTGAPQNTMRSSIKEEYTKEAWKLMEENGIDLNNVICHAPYIINLANREKEDAWKFSINFLKNEISRVAQMKVKYIVVHPGNYLKMPVAEALKNISDALNQVLDNDYDVKVLIETMAGKGTECGKNIEEIKTILANTLNQDKIGVCLDTCHLNDSGVDIKNFQEYLDLFAQEIGLDKIKCVHVNDSKNPLNSHKDRHANLGYGTIGFTNLLNVLYNEKLKDVPKILETPWLGEYPPYKFEIEMIRTKKFNPDLEKCVQSYYNKE